MSAHPLDRRLAWAVATAGLATLGVFIAFGFLPDVRAATAAGCGGATSMSQFQLARSAADLIAVFSAPGGACRAPMIAAMDAADRLDLLVFIPVYGLFLALGALLLGGWRSWLARAALLALLIGMAGDVVETSVQLRLTRMLDAPEGLLPLLHGAAWTKYGALAGNAVLLALMALRRPWPNWALTALGLATAPAVLLAYVDRDAAALMGLAFGLFWIGLIVRAVSAALRPHAVRGAIVADG